MTDAETETASHRVTMMKTDLSALPALELPPGYRARSFQPGDEAAWDRIISESFGYEQPTGHFERRIAHNDEFRESRVWFICHGDEPVATASAWHGSEDDSRTGRLHMVAALSAETGKGLGLQVSLAALHEMAREGRNSATLKTEDYRLAAIAVYLKLGFEPRPATDDQRHRWAEVFRNLGRTELLEKFAAILSGPLYKTSENA